jgi:oligosaccharide repeat unit polymerase wzy
LFRQGVPVNGFLLFSQKIFLLRNFSFILLVFPISEILNSKYSLNFLKVVFILGMLAILFRSFIWFSYNYAGLNIAPGIIAERGINWTRYGAVRLQALFLDGYVLAYVLCKLLLSASKHKLSYSLFLLITLFYEGIIYASRSQLIGFCAMFITIYLFRAKNLRNKVLSLFTLILISLGITLSPYYNEFLDSFSITNSDYGAGTMVRIVGRKYYQEIWRQVKIFGFGQTADGNIFSGWKYYLSDLGIIRILYQFGIIGFIICLLPILYGCYAGFKHRMHFEGMLLFSLSIFVFITSFASQNLYDYSRIMLLPLLLGMANNVSSGKLDRVME